MDLPIEVLVYLFKYLSKSDRNAAGQTCRLWYEAANDNCFKNKECLYFFKTTLHDDFYPINIFSNVTPWKFTHLVFREIDISSKMNKFFESNGAYIKTLEINQCEIQEKTFANIVNQCPNLESLTVENCREFFMSARFADQDTILPNNCLPKLHKLNLSNNRYLTDALFSKFTSLSENIEELDLSECPISFHSGLYKKFYPFSFNTKGEKTASESVLTFHYIFEYLQSTKNIQKMAFNKTLIDGAALKSICELDHIKITHFELNGCDQLNNEGLQFLIQNQPKLSVLNLGMCSRLTDAGLISICNLLPNLKHLSINRCRAITNLGIIELSKLCNLRSLNISQCELITPDSIKNGICTKVNNLLEELNVSYLNIDENALIMLSENLPNLKSLDVSYCFASVTDNSIQAIFRNLKNLNVLKLSHCNLVSDAGITGMGMNEPKYTDPNTETTKTHTPTGNVYQISLRSRAELEIVKDARRKVDVKEMCESFASNSARGYSLVRLQNLKYLDISGCNKITDVSLIYAFKCLSLHTLILSELTQITYEGLKPLSENCSSIEHLELIDCFNTRDEGVEVIVQNLHRLKYLHLRGCNLLTDSAVNFIKNECKALKLLDIQGCRNISAELALSLGVLPTLHTILISKPGPYITDGIKNRQPIPPPPSAMKQRRRIF